MRQAGEKKRAIPILARPEQWTVLCSALSSAEIPVRDVAYERWVGPNLHRHPYREILFALEGETLEHFSGRNYRCRPGSLFLIDVNEEHANGYPRGQSGSFTHLWIMELGGGAAASVYSQRKGGTLEQRRTPMLLSQAECNLLTRCWNAAKQPAGWMSEDLRKAALRSAVFAVVFRMMDNWHAAVEGDSASRRHREIVQAVERHIEAHLEEAGNLDSLAHVSGYSKFHLARLFKEYSGQTVHRFVDACRTTRARELERSGSLRKEIAAALGFSCPAAFSNWMRAHRSRVEI